MQKLGGRGWKILSGAISGANKAYDEYQEKEIKKDRAAALKEALTGMGYEKYGGFVDPTTGEINELGTTLLKSDLDTDQLIQKYAMLNDLEAAKRAGWLSNRKSLVDYEYDKEHGGDIELQGLKFEHDKELAKLKGSFRSSSTGRNSELPADVKRYQKLADALTTNSATYKDFVLQKGIDSGLLDPIGLTKDDLINLTGQGISIPKLSTNAYIDQGIFGSGINRKIGKVLTPEAIALAKALQKPIPAGTKMAGTPEQAARIRAARQGIIPATQQTSSKAAQDAAALEAGFRNLK